MNVPVYRSLEEILSVFSDEKYKDSVPVQELLSICKNHLNEYEENSKEEIKGRKNKFIVLEGLDGVGKSTTAKMLEEEGFGVCCHSPPHNLWDLRPAFDSDSNLRTAFYSLGNYIAAIQVAKDLKKHNVVMDRYWHSTVAFSLGRTVKNNPLSYSLPPKGDIYYSWPDDLLKPDKVFLLYVSEEERLKRLERRESEVTNEEKQLKADADFRRTVIQAYRNMFDPGVDEICADCTKEECVQKIIDRLKN